MGTAKNEKKAFSYYEKSAALGDVDGIVKVGRAWLNGIGVLTDYQKSLHFFEKAAEQDNSEAMILAAYQYENGKGVDVSFEKSLEWLTRAECGCRRRLEGELSEKDRKYYESLLWIIKECIANPLPVRSWSGEKTARRNKDKKRFRSFRSLPMKRATGAHR